jgi:hypothetical protein
MVAYNKKYIGYMNTLNKFEDMFSNWLDKFESEPIKSGFKALVVLFILKKIWQWVKS